MKYKFFTLLILQSFTIQTPEDYGQHVFVHRQKGACTITFQLHLFNSLNETQKFEIQCSYPVTCYQKIIAISSFGSNELQVTVLGDVSSASFQLISPRISITIPIKINQFNDLILSSLKNFQFVEEETMNSLESLLDHQFSVGQSLIEQLNLVKFNSQDSARHDTKFISIYKMLLKQLNPFVFQILEQFMQNKGVNIYKLVSSKSMFRNLNEEDFKKSQLDNRLLFKQLMMIFHIIYYICVNTKKQAFTFIKVQQFYLNLKQITDWFYSIIGTADPYAFKVFKKFMFYNDNNQEVEFYNANKTGIYIRFLDEVPNIMETYQNLTINLQNHQQIQQFIIICYFLRANNYQMFDNQIAEISNYCIRSGKFDQTNDIFQLLLQHIQLKVQVFDYELASLINLIELDFIPSQTESVFFYSWFLTQNWRGDQVTLSNNYDEINYFLENIQQFQLKFDNVVFEKDIHFNIKKFSPQGLLKDIYNSPINQTNNILEIFLQTKVNNIQFKLRQQSSKLIQQALKDVIKSPEIHYRYKQLFSAKKIQKYYREILKQQTINKIQNQNTSLVQYDIDEINVLLNDGDIIESDYDFKDNNIKLQQSIDEPTNSNTDGIVQQHLNEIDYLRNSLDQEIIDISLQNEQSVLEDIRQSISEDIAPVSIPLTAPVILTNQQVSDIYQDNQYDFTTLGDQVYSPTQQHEQLLEDLRQSPEYQPVTSKQPNDSDYDFENNDPIEELGLSQVKSKTVNFELDLYATPTKVIDSQPDQQSLGKSILIQSKLTEKMARFSISAGDDEKLVQEIELNGALILQRFYRGYRYFRNFTKLNHFAKKFRYTTLGTQNICNCQRSDNEISALFSIELAAGVVIKSFLTKRRHRILTNELQLDQNIGRNELKTEIQQRKLLILSNLQQITENNLLPLQHFVDLQCEQTAFSAEIRGMVRQVRKIQAFARRLRSYEYENLDNEQQIVEQQLGLTQVNKESELMEDAQVPQIHVELENQSPYDQSAFIVQLDELDVDSIIKPFLMKVAITSYNQLGGKDFQTILKQLMLFVEAVVGIVQRRFRFNRSQEQAKGAFTNFKNAIISIQRRARAYQTDVAVLKNTFVPTKMINRALIVHQSKCTNAATTIQEYYRVNVLDRKYGQFIARYSDSFSTLMTFLQKPTVKISFYMIRRMQKILTIQHVVKQLKSSRYLIIQPEESYQKHLFLLSNAQKPEKYGRSVFFLLDYLRINSKEATKLYSGQLVQNLIKALCWYVSDEREVLKVSIYKRLESPLISSLVGSQMLQNSNVHLQDGKQLFRVDHFIQLLDIFLKTCLNLQLGFDMKNPGQFSCFQLIDCLIRVIQFSQLQEIRETAARCLKHVSKFSGGQLVTQQQFQVVQLLMNVAQGEEKQQLKGVLHYTTGKKKDLQMLSQLMTTLVV